jgi:hypothetical protein
MAGGYERPSMNWSASDLAVEWRRFRQHCEFTFNGPLADKEEARKVAYLMTFIGDKGREIYLTFTWTAAQGDGADRVPAENDTLNGVYAKYEAYVAPRRNEIRATVKFNQRKQEQGERFDNFVTDLRTLVRDCNYGESDVRMIRDSIVLRSLHPRVQEKCLEEGNGLTLDRAVVIGQNYETSVEGLRAINGDEDNKVNKVFGRK